ncbi:MAG: heme-dependent oxidative N-demethylase subunit alpha family protein [Roseimicrobium sp.]
MHLRHGAAQLFAQRPRLDETITPDEVWLRLEHQLLMKLPLSSSVLFGIRVEVIALHEVMRDSTAAARLTRLVATMSDEAAAYKGLATGRGALLAILDRQA